MTTTAGPASDPSWGLGGCGMPTSNQHPAVVAWKARVAPRLRWRLPGLGRWWMRSSAGEHDLV